MKVIIDIINEMINLVTDDFYRQKENEGYKQLNELILTLIEFNNELSLETKYDKEISELKRILGEALSALEKKDTVLLADILEYDLKELLESIS